jgi:hypothetical protein
LADCGSRQVSPNPIATKGKQGRDGERGQAKRRLAQGAEDATDEESRDGRQCALYPDTRRGATRLIFAKPDFAEVHGEDADIRGHHSGRGDADQRNAY